MIDDDKVDDGESEKPRWIDLKTLKKEDFQVGVEEILEPLLKGNLGF